MQLRKQFLLVLSVVAIFSAGVAIGAQPHMENALTALQNARTQLTKADHNKGGHRVRAIELINQAISEVQSGINAGR
jgi:hypothetical protein